MAMRNPPAHAGLSVKAGQPQTAAHYEGGSGQVDLGLPVPHAIISLSYSRISGEHIGAGDRWWRGCCRPWLHGARTSALLHDHGMQVGDPLPFGALISAAEVRWPVWGRCPVGGWLSVGSARGEAAHDVHMFLG
jgi:hypothetical protein